MYNYNNDAHEKRIEIFNDTMSMCKKNKILSEDIKRSIANTKFYSADAEIKITAEPINNKIRILVTKERTFEAAKNLREKLGEEKIAVLNFASATNPGGGVINGASAQEECLCRCSTLYPCLKTQTAFNKYYSGHRKTRDPLYSDACIYIPGVDVIKTDTSLPELIPESEWYKVDVITCAAPNLRPKPNNRMNPGNTRQASISQKDLLELHKKRAKRILDVAAENGAKAVVLGAFGCGAFMNDPRIVARAYKEVLDQYPAVFDTVVFAVYCSARDTKNYEAFKAILR